MSVQDPGYNGSLDDMQLGLGYNSARHQLAGSSLVAQSNGGTASQPIVVDTTSSGSSEATIRIVTSVSDLDIVVSGSAKGSYNGGDYDVNASASFATAFKFDTTSLNYLVIAQVTSGDQQITNPVLSTLASTTLNNPQQAPGVNALGPFNLYRAFGDYYVSNITRGATLYAQIEILFQSMQDKVEAQQSIGFSSMGSKVDASAAENVQKSLSKQKITINVYSVGQVIASVPQTLTDLFTLVDTFTTSNVDSDGVVVDYELDLVTSLGDYAETSLGSQDTDLGELIDNGLQYLHIGDSIADMVVYPARYAACPSQINLQTLGSLADGNFQNISTQAQTYTKPGSVNGASYEPVSQFYTQLSGAQLPQPYRNLTDVSQPIPVGFTQVSQFIPVATHVAGGQDMDGKPTTVTANAAYAIQPAIPNEQPSPSNPPTQIVGSGSLEFSADNGTAYTGTWSALMYTAPAGLYVVSCGGVASANVQTLVQKPSNQYVTIGLPGSTQNSIPTLVSADCLLDLKGTNGHERYATNLVFNTVYLSLGHIEDYTASPGETPRA